MPRSIGRLGAAACTMRSQHAQASFGRTCRITLNRAGTYSSISETSSPRDFSLPPQSGQASCFGGYFRTSRGRCSGSGFRGRFRRDACNRRDRCRCVRSRLCSPLASPAVRPAATPVARSDDPASPTCARTASAAAWRSAASNARSRCRAKASCSSFAECSCFVLREDQGFQFVGIECVEIGERVMRGNHCRESSRLSLQQN